LDRALIEFGELPAARREGAVAGAYVRMVECAKSLRQVRSPDAQSAWRALHGTQRALDAACREHIAREQASQAGAFRWLVLGLTLAALVMVNVAVLVLFRITTMIVKPVASLVEGSRELAAERFEHRVPVGLSDEFGELAHAYNRLAERLQANEARKAETLRQLAVTLNHGLNNAMGIIELQLGMVDRESVGNPVLARHLREIRAVLARMGHIVSSLKNIRRVVLTDYAPGLQMVDLERSVEVETSPETPGVQALAGDSRETHGIGGAP
jgi:signal transduction histidine kinase